MKSLLTVSLCAALLSLSGCMMFDERDHGRNNDRDRDHAMRSYGDHHCPPLQEKKGRCERWENDFYRHHRYN